MATDVDRWVFSLSLRRIWASSLQQFPRKSMLKSQKQLSLYDRCKTQRPKEFKECRPFQIYQSALSFLWRIWRAGKQRRAAAVTKALIGRFETAFIPWIPLVAEVCTDHIEKAVFMTSASIFSETVGGMKLKFGEEIEKKLIYQDPSPFQYFCVNSSLKWRKSRLAAAKLQALSPFLVLTVTGQK